MKFPGQIDQLHSMLAWIVSQLAPLHLPVKAIHQIELACEEALVNIIEHGGTDKIEILVERTDLIRITLKDQGPPFDPLQIKTPLNPTASLEERAVGGLGIHLIRRYMDDIQYRREGTTNVLILSRSSQRE